jgi:Tol biopolymer transport system component
VIEQIDPSGRTRPVLRTSGFHVFSPSVTQDAKWMAMVMRKAPSEHRVIAFPLLNGAAAPESEWVSVAGPGFWVDKPRWSPGGNVLYYVSDRDGFVCIWSRRVDARTRKPVEDERAVAHFHRGRNSLGSVYGLELAVARDKLVFNLGEESGNIWLAPAK